MPQHQQNQQALFADLAIAKKPKPQRKTRAKPEPAAAPTTKSDEPPTTQPDVAVGIPVDHDGHRILYVDPARVRVGHLNPRLYADLDERSCAELRRMIAAVGQVTPVLVRRIYGDPDYDYEIIAGARRHWCVSSLRAVEKPELLLMVAVIDMSDEAAVRAAFAENLARTGVSAYERGIYLQHQLEHVYGGSRPRMEKDLAIDPGLVSRLLTLADWPKPLLDAFGRPRAITVEDVVAVQSLRDKAGNDIVLTHAEALADEQAARRRGNVALLSATEVRKRLIEAIDPASAPIRIIDEGGTVRLIVRSSSRNGLTVYVPDRNRHRHRQLIDAIADAVRRVQAE